MDYKELIEELHFLSGHVPEQMCDDDGKDPLERAATAIETLLAERDAAMDDLNGQCDKCKFLNISSHDFPCCHCIVTGGMNDYWKWRGIQKEGGGDG